MFVSRKTFQGGTGGNESLTFTFPVTETVSQYSINTNAVNWTLTVDNTLKDTRMYQYSKPQWYTLNTPVEGKTFTFKSNLILGSNSLYVSNITFTNSRGYQIAPFMSTNSTYSNPIKSQGSIQGTTSVSPSASFTGTTVQYSIGSNVVCSEIRLDPPLTNFGLYGSNDGASWTLLALRQNVCSTLVTSNVFRLVTPGSTSPSMRMFDVNGNEITNESGGAYRGLTTGGEWIQVDYADAVPISVYSFTVPTGRYPTWWTVQGWSGSSWNILDEQRNVYDQYTTFSNSLGTSFCSKYKLTIKAYSGYNSAQISSFKLYDDAGTLYTPKMTSKTLTPDRVYLPTSVNASVNEQSPFIVNNSFRAGDSFQITFEIPVTLYKVYIDTLSTTITIEGDGRTILTSSNFNKIAETSVRVPCKQFRFRNFNQPGSNITLFGSKGRLNPIFQSTTSNTHVYGGYGSDTISITLPPNSSNGNLYSFVGSLAAWDLEGNVNGNWQTIESVSNVYGGITLPYQNNFKSTNYSGYRLVVKEIQPTQNMYYRVNCFQVISNTFTPMIPYDTNNPLVSTSLVGRFNVSCSDFSASGLLDLFKFGNTNEVRIQNNGDKYIQITLPYGKPVTYYYLKCGRLPSDSTGGTVKLIGYLSDTNSNILSVTNLNFTSPFQSLKFSTSNLTAFKTYQFLFSREISLTGVGLDAHMPNGSVLSYGNEMYGGSGNEWIQLSCNNDPGQLLSYIKLDSNTFIPSNIIVTNNLGQELGNYIGYTNTKSVSININTSNVIRITSREMIPNPFKYTSFNLSNIGLYNSKNDKIVAPFPNVTPPDPLNNVITVSGVSTFGGLAKKEQSLYVNIYPNTTLTKYYILKSSLARKWVIRGSPDNSTWYTLDSREITDSRVNAQDETTYIFYHNQTSNTNRVYSYFTANIIETYSSTDGAVSINEFSILNDKRYRVMSLKNSTGTYPYYSGTEYTGTTTIQDNLLGDYILWSFPKAATLSNVTINLPQNAHIQAFTLFGQNKTSEIWEPIIRYNDSRKLGTYIFGGSIQNPSNAFIKSGYCDFGRTLPSDVSITLPDDLTPVKYYKVVSASSSLNFSNPTSWKLYADGNEVSMSGSLDQLIEITPLYAQKYTLEITGSENLNYPVFIQNLFLYDSNRNQLYYNDDFVSNKNFQTIEKYFLSGSKPIQFNTVTQYSNIALVVQNFLREPYESNGIADLSVSFAPTPFRGVGYLYDNNQGDILSGSANVTIYSTLRNPTTATYCRFNSTNANTWALYGSTDGQSWSVLTRNSNVISNPQPASYYRIEVSNIIYRGEGTTSISNVHIGDGVLPEWPSDIMSSNVLDITTTLTTDTYSTSGARQVLST